MDVGVVSQRLLIRKSLCALIQDLNGCRVVLETDTPLDNLDEVRKVRPDILVMDTIGFENASTTVGQLCSLTPAIKIMLISESANEDFQITAIREGVQGFVSENCDPRTFEKALRYVARGETWVGHDLATRIIGRFIRSQAPDQAKNGKLTRREQEILALLAQGFANKEIANRLSVSCNTVKSQIAGLYRKIHVNGRLNAALYYFSAARDRGIAAVVLPA